MQAARCLRHLKILSSSWSDRPLGLLFLRVLKSALIHSRAPAPFEYVEPLSFSPPLFAQTTPVPASASALQPLTNTNEFASASNFCFCLVYRFCSTWRFCCCCVHQHLFSIVRLYAAPSVRSSDSQLCYQNDAAAVISNVHTSLALHALHKRRLCIRDSVSVECMTLRRAVILKIVF